MFLVQKCTDRAIVGGSFNKCFDRETLPKFQRRLSFIIAHRFEHESVIGWIDNNGNALVIFGGAADHRWATDVDILDRFGQRHIRFGDRLFKWVKVNDQKIDRLEALVASLLFMFRVASLVEQAAVHTRVQSFHPSFQHLGEPRETGNLADRDLFLTQEFRRATGGNNIDTLFFESAGEVGNASLVGNGNKGADDFHQEGLKR